MSAPLSGIKVVGLSTWVAMPAACAILGDWGAEVIKIEHPVGGDPARNWKPESRGLPVCPLSPLWEHDNRNQKSIAVDLAHEGGRQIAYKLVKNADIFATNLQEPSLKSVFMDYDTLKNINQRLIYAHLTGYGPKGPNWAKPGFDHTGFWASSGIMASLGEPDETPPLQRPGMGDHVTSLAIVAGITAALFVRERQGLPQRVDFSLLTTGMWMNAIQIQASLLSGQDIRRLSRKNIPSPIMTSYRCKDDRWIQFTMFHERFWQLVCRALGIEHLEQDPRFCNPENRTVNAAELISIFDSILATRDLSEWGKIFDKYDLVWAPVNTVKEVVDSPQALANQYIVEMQHPVLGTMKSIASPFKFSETPPEPPTPSPTLGQHTDEILLELGYKQDDIKALRKDKVIL